jgi:hypothetical protein
MARAEGVGVVCAKETGIAHLHFRRTVYKSGGRAARDRLAYITGRATSDPDWAGQQLRYLREGREDLVQESTRNLPGWAAGNPLTFFQAAEQYEGGGATLHWTAFEEWKITLPFELSRVQNLALAEDLLEAIAGDTLPCTATFHEPRTLDGTQPQPHLHLLISSRQTDAHPRTAATHFKRFNARAPEKGGAQKESAFQHLGAVKAWRVLISDVINLHLERHGLEARVHPDRLAAQGIARVPEPKLLPSESHAYRAHGTVSETMQEVLTLRAARQQSRPREQEHARVYWEQRKEVLGLTDDLPPPAQLGRIGAARGLVRPARDQGPEVAPGTGWSTMLQDLEAITRQLDALGGDRGIPGHLRIHVWDTELEAGRGLG